MPDAREIHEERSVDTVAAGRRVAAAMEGARDLLDEHYRWCDLKYSGAHNEHGIEARKRLTQLIWVLRRVTDLHQEASDLFTETFPWEMADRERHKIWQEKRDRGDFDAATRKQMEVSDEIELLAEMFYYAAFRAQSIFSKRLPGLSGFDATGVRIVRNHLIEHPEGRSSGVVANGFGYGMPRGPVLKAVRDSEQSAIHPDAGLFNNAAEFAEILVRKIRAALAA
jgi:hypothetical protein